MPPRQTIQKSNTNLLMEAARRLDEWRVLSRKIPSVELVPKFIVLENREGQINLNTMEWLLLSKIDGQRTVRQIATTAGMGVFDAAKLLDGLVAANLIRLKESAGSAAAGPTPRPGRARSRLRPRHLRGAARPLSRVAAPFVAGRRHGSAAARPSRPAARRVHQPARSGGRERRAEALPARAQ